MRGRRGRCIASLHRPTDSSSRVQYWLRSRCLSVGMHRTFPAEKAHRLDEHQEPSVAGASLRLSTLRHRVRPPIPAEGGYIHHQLRRSRTHTAFRPAPRPCLHRKCNHRPCVAPTWTSATFLADCRLTIWLSVRFRPHQHHSAFVVEGRFIHRCSPIPSHRSRRSSHPTGHPTSHACTHPA